MSRWLRFIIVLILGLGLGLLYGWVIDPVEYIDTFPESLREDYKTDYVLMVAEAYHQDGDFNFAKDRLGFLGDDDPGEYVDDALYFAVESGYAPADLRLIRALSDILATGIENQGNNQP